MTPSIAIGITCFNAPMRLRRILQICYDMSLLPGVPIRIVEDPWKPECEPQYRAVAKEFGLPYTRCAEWSCMQGSIQKAVEISPEDWFVYFSDDVLPTPGAFENIIKWIRILDSYPVSLIQFPYWNADELPPWAKTWPHKDEMWGTDTAWLKGIPENQHWNGPGYPRPYINVNGAGFALRRDSWKWVGGFSQKTWCLDEDISLKVWTKTNHSIITVPGPPFVHYMGASLEHPEHHFHCMDCWHAAGWPDKDVCEKMARKIMQKRCGDEATWWPRQLATVEAEGRRVEGIAV